MNLVIISCLEPKKKFFLVMRVYGQSLPKYNEFSKFQHNLLPRKKLRLPKQK